MTMSEAINSLDDGQAAKRSTWGGYVKKVVTSAAGAAVTTFTLTYVNRSGTSYEYSFDGTAWTAPATELPVDAEIQEAMLANDWTTGSTDAFETARQGTGTW